MKIKLRDGTLLSFPTRPLSLGDQRLQKREFGVVPARDGYEIDDPDSMSAMLFHAIRLHDPELSARAIIGQIDRIKQIDIVDDDGNPLKGDVSEDDVPDPTPAEPSDSEPEHSE